MELWIDAALIVLGALLIDAIIGDLPNAVHPLRWMGNILGWLDRRIRRGGRTATRLKGFLSFLLVVFLFGSAAFLVLSGVRIYLGEIAWIIVSAFLLKITFAVFSFRRHCRPIKRDLENGDTAAAAAKVQMIVSRRTEGMDSEHIASSCCETISENFADSVVSPMFFNGILGLPGAIVFRCSNLMDAMWGYLNDKYGDLGFFPARFDDVLGYLTSRISPAFLALAAVLMRMDWRAAIPAARADHGKTPSPNSGWPMTAAAAVLGISMEKKDVYVMGTGPLPTPEDISRCYRLVELSSVLFIIMAGLPLFCLLGIHVQLYVEGAYALVWGLLP